MWGAAAAVVVGGVTPLTVPFPGCRVGPTTRAVPDTLIVPLPDATSELSVPVATPFRSVTCPFPSARTATGALSVQSRQMTWQLPLAAIGDPAVKVAVTPCPSRLSLPPHMSGVDPSHPTRPRERAPLHRRNPQPPVPH